MADKAHPISPSEVASKKAETLPDAVLESFNELITAQFTGGSITIRQDDVVALMEKKGVNRKDIFDNGYLNVEEPYRAAGWKVKYDKASYNESYPANFTFTPR